MRQFISILVCAFAIIIVFVGCKSNEQSSETNSRKETVATTTTTQAKAENQENVKKIAEIEKTIREAIIPDHEDLIKSYNEDKEKLSENDLWLLVRRTNSVALEYRRFVKELSELCNGNIPSDLPSSLQIVEPELEILGKVETLVFYVEYQSKDLELYNKVKETGDMSLLEGHEEFNDLNGLRDYLNKNIDWYNKNYEDLVFLCEGNLPDEVADFPSSMPNVE